MITIKKIYKQDVPELMQNNSFWKEPFLSISRHRLLAHFNNPNLQTNDIVLLLAYQNKQLVGYMGAYIDIINLENTNHKIAWLSTWWVHPKTKGTGIGREILNTMYDINNGKIGISQFTPSAKRVYDKSQYFTDLAINRGIKAVLRSNLSFVIPALIPKNKIATSILNQVDDCFNFFINIKLKIQKSIIINKLKNLQIEYLNYIDPETQSIIDKHSKVDLSTKNSDYFQWLKAYNWVQKAPLLELTEKEKYQFSIYDREFEFSLMKINQNDKPIAFIVLQKRNFTTKILFTYFDNTIHTSQIADLIKLQSIIQNTREIISYDDAISLNFKKSYFFLYKTEKLKQSIISKAFDISNFEKIRVQFGDGDCAFA